jgi:phosphatidylserine/phosphatidylglycerophosphate/cardiolipin synthase-like enzyme
MRLLRAAWLASLFALPLLCAPFGCSSSGAPITPSGDTSIDEDADAAETPPAPTDSPTTLVVEPDDGRTPLLNAIQGAKRAVHVEAYMLTDQPLIDALVAAKKAGRDVKVVLEQYPYLASGANDAAFSALRSAGVSVTWVQTTFQLTHTKTLVIDPGQPTGVAWIMSLNLSAVAFTGNRDYAALASDPADVAEADAVILADYANTADARVTHRLVVSPEDSRTKLTAMIDASTKTLDVEMEELSDGTIQARLATAVKRGVVVRLVMASSPSSTTKASLDWLKANGVLVKTLSTPDMHAKAMIVDGARAYVGSVNFTAASLDKNREIGVITDTPATLTRLSTTIAADYAKGTPY